MKQNQNDTKVTTIKHNYIMEPGVQVVMLVSTTIYRQASQGHVFNTTAGQFLKKKLAWVHRYTQPKMGTNTDHITYDWSIKYGCMLNGVKKVLDLYQLYIMEM